MNPNMISYSKNRTAQIGEIANRLANNFAKLLYNFCTEKNFYVYIGILTEINAWAHEFYEQYRDELNDWEAFKKSGENIYNAATPNEFLVAWGNTRANKFFIVNAKEFGNAGINEDNKTGYQFESLVKTAAVRKPAFFNWQQQLKYIYQAAAESADGKAVQDS